MTGVRVWGPGLGSRSLTGSFRVEITVVERASSLTSTARSPDTCGQEGGVVRDPQPLVEATLNEAPGSPLGREPISKTLRRSSLLLATWDYVVMNVEVSLS